MAAIPPPPPPVFNLVPATPQASEPVGSLLPPSERQDTTLAPLSYADRDPPTVIHAGWTSSPIAPQHYLTLPPHLQAALQSGQVQMPGMIVDSPSFLSPHEHNHADAVSPVSPMSATSTLVATPTSPGPPATSPATPMRQTVVERRAGSSADRSFWPSSTTDTCTCTVHLPPQCMSDL